MWSHPASTPPLHGLDAMRVMWGAHLDKQGWRPGSAPGHAIPRLLDLLHQLLQLFAALQSPQPCRHALCSQKPYTLRSEALCQMNVHKS